LPQTNGKQGSQEDLHELAPTKPEIEQDLKQFHVVESEVDIDLCDSILYKRLVNWKFQSVSVRLRLIQLQESRDGEVSTVEIRLFHPAEYMRASFG
jgi:hypothetical protein